MLTQVLLFLQCDKMWRCNFTFLGFALLVVRQLLEIVGVHTSPAGTKN